MGTAGFLSQAVLDKFEEFDVSTFQPTKLSWLPTCTEQRKPQRVGPNDEFFLSLDEDDYRAHMWRLLELTVPPLLAKKFHVMSAEALLHDSSSQDMNFAAIATWFVTFTKAFGLEFLDDLEGAHMDLSDPIEHGSGHVSQRKMKKATDKAKELYTRIVLKYTSPSVKPYKPEDLCTSAGEFLLEPAILIQLPWQPVLLHQWLVAAFAEVLIIDRDSAELRCLPVDKTMRQCATDLLILVRNLKQRLLLGFGIWDSMVMSPKSTSKKLEQLMDVVVLPSLPALEFLISRKAQHLLNSIKKISWPGNDQDHKSYRTRTELLPPGASLLHEEFNLMYNELFYNFMPWLTHELSDLSIQGPFSLVCDDKDLYKKVNVVQSNSQQLTDDSTRYNSQTFMLLSFLASDESTNNLSDNGSESLNNVFEIYRDYAIKAGRVSAVEDLSFKDHVAMLNNAMKVKYSNDYSTLRDLTEESKVAGLAFRRVHNLLLKAHEEPRSVLAQLMYLSLEVVEKEQLFHLLDAQTSIMDLVPKSPEADSLSQPLTPESMEQQLAAVNVEITQKSRDWLFKQFPSEWRKPVKPAATIPDICLEVGANALLNKNVMDLETRIGRLVYNVAKDCFKVNAKGGVVFPHWHEVQYILPCLVAGLVKTFDAVPQSANVDLASKLSLEYVTLIYHLLQHYEEAYRCWSTTCPAKQLGGGNSKLEDMQTTVLEWDIILQGLQEETRRMSIAYLTPPHVVTVKEAQLFSLEPILSVMNDYPLSRYKIKHFLDLYNTMQLSFQFSQGFYMLVMRCCHKGWRVPVPSLSLTVEPLGEDRLPQLYFAGAVIADLILLYRIYLAKKGLQGISALDGLLTSSVPCVLLQLLRAVTFPHLYQPMAEELANRAKPQLVLVYRGLRHFRDALPSMPSPRSRDALPRASYVPAIKNACTLYLAGKLDKLDELMACCCDPKAAVVDDQFTRVQRCDECHKSACQVGRTLQPCQPCISGKYPRPNWYCSAQCQQKRWKEEHMAEHLEFELGIGEFGEAAAAQSAATAEASSAHSHTK